MSEQVGNSPKKFPYLVLPNAPKSFENTDEVFSSRGVRDNQLRREAKDVAPPKNIQDVHGTSYRGPGYLSFMEGPYQAHTNFIAHSVVNPQFNEYNHPHLNSISMNQMKAILTAQSELRKPAGSLYPSASQISLIPETEMIYKKYFPSDGNECKVEKPASKVKMHEKGQTGVLKKNNSTNNEYHLGTDLKDKNETAYLSASESNLAACERKKKTEGHVVDGGTVRSTRMSEESSKMSNEKVLKQREAEARFKKRIQSQLVSLCAEVERQASELVDVKREFKELLHMSRKNSTDIDSSKVRLDTLSKHVQEIDNKMDTMQESVSGQEKSLLSKLMLFGEISDSDSDLDDTGIKGIDVLSCPSTTKLAILSSSTTKRPFSSGSTSDCLPKSCCNWVPIAPDFDKLIQAVALINYRMDRNQSMKLCTTNNGATFKHSDVIDLTIFKNGIILGSTGFRSYSTMSVIRFVNEIFNGYLPTELSTQYPDGVVIVLTDKRSVIHSYDENFNGSGSKLSSKDPPDLLPGAGINTLQKKDSEESIKASITESILSLPDNSGMQSASESSNYEILPELEEVEETEEVKTRHKIITLKVKERKTGRRYKVRVPVNATIRVVTNHLSRVLAERDAKTGHSTDGSANLKSYDIILPVPHGKLSCTSSTLEEYGLTQNTLVYIQERNS